MCGSYCRCLFIRNHQVSSQVVVPFYAPTSSVGEPPFASDTHQHLETTVCLLSFSYSGGCVVVYYQVLICISLMTSFLFFFSAFFFFLDLFIYF